MGSKRVISWCASAVFSYALMAQPQWRLHLAFEDGTGARDTIWFVWDTSATEGSEVNPLVDELLGEGQVDMDMDSFNVWVWNWSNDSTKTFALPFLYFPWHGCYIDAFNYEFPVTLRWDTALFHATYLPNPAAIQTAKMDCAHFFGYNNDPFLQAYNMLLDDSVVVELMFPNDYLFPLQVFIDGDAHAGLSATTATASIGLTVWPTPTSDVVEWLCPEPVRKVSLLDFSGGVKLSVDVQFARQKKLYLSSLNPGVYLLEAVGASNQRYHAKLLIEE